jgi:hypothetical protein
MASAWIPAVVLVFGVAFPAHGQLPASPRPDLSGQWKSESAANAGPAGTWGSSIQIRQTEAGLTVQPASGKPEQYKLDGSETAEVISASGCVNRTRITKAVATGDTVTITTWMVFKASCVHGEVNEEPFISGPGPIEVRDVRGLRKLESITLISRQGGELAVDSTRSTPDGPVSTSATYRRQG